MQNTNSAHKTYIENLYQQTNTEKNIQLSAQDIQILKNIITQLDTGKLRVAEKIDQTWIIHQWIKQAILLYIKHMPLQEFNTQYTQYLDKIAGKFHNKTMAEIQQAKLRIVPPANVRFGAYLAPGVVVMPAFVNIGAYIDCNCMLDSWTTIGSCAQIGKNVHVSMNAGIGGVLEPLQANPTIIEDNCFIGAGAQIAEGMLIKQGAVIGMGVHLNQSTKILDRTNQKISYAIIPENAVVVPGTINSKDGSHQINCAIIAKYADQKTRNKIGINQLLRMDDAVTT